MHLLEVLLSFPTALYTLLLGICLLYWLFVLIGALELDLLGGAGHALDGHADGALDGHLDGAIDGHADAALDGHADAAMDGHADGAGHDGSGHGHDVDGDDGMFASVFSALKLRSAPVTVVLSVFSLVGWLSTGLVTMALEGAGGWIARAGLFVAWVIVSLLVTSVVIRPLGSIFDRKGGATKNADLFGKVVVVSTGTVTEKFGQATLDEAGINLTLQVRAAASLGLKKGTRCVIVDHDDEGETFSIEAMPDLEPRPRIDTRRARVSTPENEADPAPSTTSETPGDATRRA